MIVIIAVCLLLLALGPLSSVESCRRVSWLLSPEDEQAITPAEIGPSGCGCWLWGWGATAVGLALLAGLMLLEAGG